MCDDRDEIGLLRHLAALFVEGRDILQIVAPKCMARRLWTDSHGSTSEARVLLLVAVLCELRFFLGSRWSVS